MLWNLKYVWCSPYLTLDFIFIVIQDSYFSCYINPADCFLYKLWGYATNCYSAAVLPTSLDE